MQTSPQHHNVGRSLMSKPAAVELWQRKLLPGALVIATLGGPANADSTFSDPHPQRLDAMLNGRDFEYNPESFLHRLSYQNLSAMPFFDSDGLYGTAGSVTGDELYIDYELQKTLPFDNQRNAVFARMQRKEDFDGRFDRQLIGISHRITEQWQLALLGDVTGDKGNTDIQLEADWRAEQATRLRLALAFTDALFNQKSDFEGEYNKEPITAFLQLSHHWTPSLSVELAINLSPEAEFENRATGVTVSSEQGRMMAALHFPISGAWLSSLQLQLEDTRRDFSFQRSSPPPADNFDREAYQLQWRVVSPTHPYQPQLGLRHMHLREQGWFGDGLAVSGENRREETTVFAGITLDTGERQSWQPTLFISQVRFERNFVQEPGSFEDRNEWRAKLNLPWRYQADLKNGAVFTINPTLRLDQLKFGGGNIQIHWPF